MIALVVGGSRGLGAQIAKLLRERDIEVIATGTQEFEVSADTQALLQDTRTLVQQLPTINLLVYAAGRYEHGHIRELPEDHILTALNIGLTAPALLVRELLEKQGSLGGFIAITSTSQWRPREYEPVYSASKAGLGMLAASLSCDPAIQKTLVVGPAGMDTALWEGLQREGALLSAARVASYVIELWDGAFTFKLARILRDPERVELLEVR